MPYSGCYGEEMSTFCGIVQFATRNFKKEDLYFYTIKLQNWDGRIRTSEMPGPKPGALPLGDVPLLPHNTIVPFAKLKVKYLFVGIK